MNFFEQARRRWPFAHWISGEGRYAVVEDCEQAPRVMLSQTLADALKRLRYLHCHACCELCVGRHRLIDLRTDPGG